MEFKQVMVFAKHVFFKSIGIEIFFLKGIFGIWAVTQNKAISIIKIVIFWPWWYVTRDQDNLLVQDWPLLSMADVSAPTSTAFFKPSQFP